MENMDVSEQHSISHSDAKPAKNPRTSFRGKMKRGSPGHMRRDTKRQDSFRQKKGNEFQKEYKDNLRAKLFLGTSIEAALPRLEMGSNQVPVQMTMSTRGIGFAISHYFHQASFIKNIVYGELTIYTFYRVYLALFETRMRQLNTEKPLSDRFIGQTPLRSADLINIVFSLTSAPEYIALILTQVGVVKTNERTYIPCLAPMRHDREDKLIPSPESVLYSTLESVVRSLSSRDTPRRYRQIFRQYSPLPGAYWDDEDVLVNSRDFWPQGYTLDQLQRDINSVSIFNGAVQKQFPKLVATLPKLSGYPGGRGMLVSCDISDIAQVEKRAEDEVLSEYYSRCLPSGNQDAYHSPESMTDAELLLGQLALLGELTPYRSGFDPFFIPRMRPAACFEHRSSWQSALQITFS